MYKLLVRPILFRFEAEKAHNLALQSAAVFNRQKLLTTLCHRLTAVRNKSITVAGLTFPNRIGLAGGMDKNAVAPRAWWAFGFGFVELGTITPRPQAGNDQPRMFRIVEQNAVRNRMGFNNAGAEIVAKRLAEQSRQGLRPPFPIGISVGKNKDTPADQAADDYASAASQLKDHADFLTINVSSPNTPGLRSFQDVEQLRPLIQATKKVIGSKPLFVKFAPELTGDPLAAVVDCCMTEGCAGIIATNTLAQFDANGLPMGGLSGRPLRDISAKRVEEIRKRLGDGPALIGCGGVENYTTAIAMQNAGADLVQIYTAIVYEGPFLAAKLARCLK